MKETPVTQIVVLYKTPKDKAHFEKHYREVHAPLAAKMPGMKSHSFGPAHAADGSDGEYFWFFSANFASQQAIADAFGSKEGQAAVADIPNYYHETPTILVVETTDG